MDYKGFGHSEGTRGYIGDRNEFYTDGFNFVKKARKFYEDLYPGKKIPFVTIGYSQGGAMALGVARYLKENGEEALGGQI